MWVSPHLLKFTIYFVMSGGQLSQFFDLRFLSYLEHWTGVVAKVHIMACETSNIP